jgi:DNA invertase Pin-like site-specific DNA recombinase
LGFSRAELYLARVSERQTDEDTAMTGRPNGERGGAYVRVSDDSQDAARQRSQIETWLSTHGLPSIQWYVDEGGSRHKAERRPEFLRLMADVEEGKLDWVVVDSQDRFGTKHAYEHGHYLNRLISQGCELWSVAQGLLSNPDDPVAVMMGGIASLTSRREIKEKARRTLGGHVKKAERGLYQGGPPPFAFDVGIFDRQGNEKWRVVFEGRQRRLKRYRDGTTEEYNGKDNFPSYDATDEARLTPTLDEAKRAAAVKVFEWYADEAISFNQIARRLNKLNVPYMGVVWRSSTVQRMLTNPIYRGVRAYGKTTQAEFYRHANGRIEEVPWHKNRPVVEKGPRTDYIVPAEEFNTEPLIPRELWERVQGRVEQRKAPSHFAPRTSGLWLRGLLYCGRCGKPMQGYNPSQSPSGRESYVCGSYMSHGGPENPTGCRRNAVRASTIESLLFDYLERTGRKIESVLKTRNNEPLLGNLVGDLGEKEEAILATYRDMGRFVDDSISAQAAAAPKEDDPRLAKLAGVARALAKAAFDPASPHYTLGGDAKVQPKMVSLVELYQWVFRAMEADAREELGRKESQFDELYQAFKEIKSERARRKADAEMATLEREIDSLKAKLVPLTSRLDHLYEDLENVGDLVENAKASLEGDRNRVKAEQVRRVVSKVICHFKDTGHRGNRPQSVLERVEIIPVEGDPENQEVSYCRDRSA